VYLVAGTGPDLEEVARAAASAGVSERVGLLGRVDESFREDLLAGVDLFAVPNVPVPGDMEGFGLVAIEAAMRGTPVLASRLEGLRDAVTDGVTGFTCEPEDAACYIERITALAKNRQELEASAVRFQSAAREMYGVDTMIRNMPAAFDLDAS
jgi:glycosyltransferase involved in cell wall biosynthesis